MRRNEKRLSTPIFDYSSLLRAAISWNISVIVLRWVPDYVVTEVVSILRRR